MSSKLLMRNEFELFNLSPSFDVDLELLNKRYRELQQQHHPDNFASQDASIYNEALQVSALINSSYITLKSPLLRSQCLLRLFDVALDLAHDTQLPMSFIILQMEIHEAIADAKQAKDITSLESIEREIKQQQNQLITQLAHEFSVENLVAAKELTKQLSFCDKLLANIGEVINNLI